MIVSTSEDVFFGGKCETLKVLMCRYCSIHVTTTPETAQSDFTRCIDVSGIYSFIFPT